MHELLLRKYGTDILRCNILKVVKGNFGLELFFSWYQHVNFLLGEWVGLNLTYFFELFLCELLWYWRSLLVTATLPYYFYNSHSYCTKTKIFKDSISQRCILLLFVIIYIITTISTTMITTITLQYSLYIYESILPILPLFRKHKKETMALNYQQSATGSAIFTWISRDTDPQPSPHR